MPAVDTILVPVDFSEPCREAADLAQAFGASLGAKVHLLHVYELAPYDFPENPAKVPETQSRLKAELEHRLEEMAAPLRSAGLAVATHLERGRVVDRILEVQASLGAQLIVIGTHGRTGLKRMLLGSIAERVVQLSPVPVCSVGAQD